jgi:hypothetical protein
MADGVSPIGDKLPLEARYQQEFNRAITKGLGGSGVEYSTNGQVPPKGVLTPISRMWAEPYNNNPSTIHYLLIPFQNR